MEPPIHKLLEDKELLDDSIAHVSDNILTKEASNNYEQGICLNIHQGLVTTVLDRRIAECA